MAEWTPTPEQLERVKETLRWHFLRPDDQGPDEFWQAFAEEVARKFPPEGTVPVFLTPKTIAYLRRINLDAVAAAGDQRNEAHDAFDAALKESGEQ